MFFLIKSKSRKATLEPEKSASSIVKDTPEGGKERFQNRSSAAGGGHTQARLERLQALAEDVHRKKWE